jgi:excisionase family DNA binding protein
LSNSSLEVDALLTPAEVAAILYVDPKTVTRWAMAGKISCLRTPGGHRRFVRSEILALATVVRSQKHSPWQPAGPADESGRSPAPVVPGLPPVRTSREAIENTRLAAGTVARAVALAREVQALEAAQSVISTRFAVEVAAGIAADAAARARAGRAAAASAAAQAVARSAGRTAAAVQRRADASATALREAAVQAAAVVATAERSPGDHAIALTALHLAAAAQATAVTTAQDTAAAAAVVATAVAATAAEVARTVSDLDVAIEGEVAEAAAAVQTRAAATARQVAADMDARATSVALVAREAVTAATLLQTHDDEPAPRDQNRHGAPHGDSMEKPDGRP